MVAGAAAPGTVMGVPTEPATAAGLLTPDEVARAADERVGPPLVDDVSVGRFVEDRVGAAVVDRLVEPLLAGVYAGHAHRLSLRATVPALWAAAASGAPIVGHPVSTDLDGPVFAGYRGGLGALAAGWRGWPTAASDPDRRHRPGAGPTAGRVAPDGGTDDHRRAARRRWRRPRRAGHSRRPAAARDGPGSAVLLDAVEYASVAIVTLALPPRPRAGWTAPGSRPAGRAAHDQGGHLQLDEVGLARRGGEDVVLVRASLGRAGEVEVLQQDDADLVQAVVADLRTVLGPDLPAPVDAHVQRWGGALPQYAVDHLTRVQTVLDAVGTLPGWDWPEPPTRAWAYRPVSPRVARQPARCSPPAPATMKS